MPIRIPRYTKPASLSLLLGFFLLVNSNAQAASDGSKTFLQSWQFRQQGDTSWRAASVPGTVHDDLLRHGLIPDPYFQDNESKVQWVEQADWVYKCHFNHEAHKGENLALVFEGLDTYVAIYLNGKELLQADNMFRSWKIDVTHRLRKLNVLELHFSSAVNRGKMLAAALPYRLPEGERVFTRKAQYQYGWDWGPRLLGCGIWKPVYLEVLKPSRIESLYIANTFLSTDTALLDMKLDIFSEKKGEYQLILQADDPQVPIKEMLIKLKPGLNEIATEFKVPSPRLWWPNGWGEAALYRFKASLVYKGSTVATREIQTGIRTVALVQEADSAGSSFYFKVNGLPLFARGANYIPADFFPSRIDSARYASVIDDARHSNMNMIRVWGGGIYESDLFYQLCDQAGLLVWQDFMFACAMYPGDQAFLENVRQEARENIRRLRHHPCLALWCGNNEIDEGWHNWGWQKQQGYTAADSARIWNDYQRLFHELLPGELQALDPSRPYWPSSPSTGWGRKESLTRGDVHYWGVWWGMENFETYTKKVGRFVSEYGFQGYPDPNTLLSFTGKEQYYRGSDAMKAHQKHPRGEETIAAYMERDYPVPKKLETYAYTSQLLQADGIRQAIEAHRRGKPYCMGSLYWQLNDCWPVISWSGIDFHGRWKAMQYAVRKAFEPVLVSAEQESNGDLSIYLVNDRSRHLAGTLEVRLFTLYGNLLLYKGFRNLEVSPLTNTLVQVMKEDYLPLVNKFGKDNCVMSFIFKDIDGNKYKNQLYFAAPKDLKLSHDLSWDITQLGPGEFNLQLKAKKLLKGTWIWMENKDVICGDNLFDMMPGEETNIRCRAEVSLEEMVKNLRVISLGNIGD